VLCPAVPPWDDEGILEYSTATGKLVRALYKSSSNCVPGYVPPWILWTSADGNAVIGFLTFATQGTKKSIVRFGVFTAHKFTPLPVPHTSNLYVVVW
jgi:hypothetical protein